MDAVNLAEKFAQFDERWSPKLVGECNDQAIKLAKLEGEFVWHSHADADELFLVVEGRLTIQLREDDDVELGPGELVVVPCGVEHRPVAPEEAHVLLLEPPETRNTGDVRNERTIENLESL